MPVRTAFPGGATSVPGHILTASDVNSLPGGWTGYAEVTANQGSITAMTDITGLSVTVTVNTSRRIRITGHGRVGSTVATDRIICYIRESSTNMQVLRDDSPSATAQNPAFEGSVILTPSAGSHTYKVSVDRPTGTGTVTMYASGTAPAFILVEDLGPA